MNPDVDRELSEAVWDSGRELLADVPVEVAWPALVTQSTAWIEAQARVIRKRKEWEEAQKAAYEPCPECGIPRRRSEAKQEEVQAPTGS